jgi:hypothetical protein
MFPKNLGDDFTGTLVTDCYAGYETPTWKGISPIVKVLEGVYQTGVKVAKKAFRMLQKHLRQHDELGK